MTLVWGIRKDGPKEKLQRAQWLFRELEDARAQIVLPAIALAEYLTPIPADRHGDSYQL
jgi:hypothetical protein